MMELTCVCIWKNIANLYSLNTIIESTYTGGPEEKTNIQYQIFNDFLIISESIQSSIEKNNAKNSIRPCQLVDLYTEMTRGGQLAAPLRRVGSTLRLCHIDVVGSATSSSSSSLSSFSATVAWAIEKSSALTGCTKGEKCKLVQKLGYSSSSTICCQA